MLQVSWNTLRSSRPLLNRTFVAYSHHHQSRTLNLNDLVQNLRATHRHNRHNYSIDSGPSSNISSAFPIDVLDAQSSFRTFCVLVEQDRLEEAKVVMRDAVEASPTAAVMSQFKQVLLDTPEKSGTLIIDLASIFASKGEQQMVRDHLLPVLRNVADSDALQQLETLLSAPSVSPQTETPDSVFEDLVIDYESVCHATPAPSPSIMELVQQKLPALLPEVSASDSSIFEADEEYTFVSPPVTSTENPLSSSHFLLCLIKKNQLEKAYQLLGELQELGTPIPKSQAYEAAVIASMNSPDISANERASRILAWLQLLPDTALGNSGTRYNIRPMIRQLNTMKTTNLQLLVDLTVVLAGKGYINALTFDIVPTIIRYSKFELARQFLEAVINAHMRYDEAPSTGTAFNMPLTHIYSTAVRTLVRHGRLENAVTLLAEATAKSILITKPSVDILMSRLEKSNQVELITKVKDLQWDRRSIAVTANRKSSKKLTSHLPSALRVLKKGVILGILPSPKDITRFMNDYVSTGRNIGLTLLLQKALYHSFFSSNVLLFSEMMLYHQLGHHDLVLQAFVEHFHLAGIPREEVLALHLRLMKEREQHIPTPSSPSPARRVVSPSRIVHPRGKLWPAMEHINLVWIALAHYAQSNQSLETLYTKLLRFAKTGKDRLDDSATLSTASLMSPLRLGKSNAKVSAMSFMPFIRPMMHSFGEERGVRILNDMVEIGLRPTLYHYTELAAFYSRKGMSEKTFLVLDYMEEQGASNSMLSQAQSSTEPASISIYSFLSGQMGAIPKPDLALYVTLLRGFIRCRDVEAAIEVLRRLCRVHQYVPGEDSYLDSALVHLYELKTQGSAWVPKPY